VSGVSLDSQLHPPISGEVEMQATPSLHLRQRRTSRGDLDFVSTPPKISEWLEHNPLRVSEVKNEVLTVASLPLQMRVQNEQLVISSLQKNNSFSQK